MHISHIYNLVFACMYLTDYNLFVSPNVAMISCRFACDFDVCFMETEHVIRQLHLGFVYARFSLSLYSHALVMHTTDKVIILKVCQ